MNRAATVGMAARWCGQLKIGRNGACAIPPSVVCIRIGRPSGKDGNDNVADDDGVQGFYAAVCLCVCLIVCT